MPLMTSQYGAGGGTRTHTGVSPKDFESSSSANSNTPAYIFKSYLPKASPRNRRDIQEGHKNLTHYSIVKDLDKSRVLSIWAFGHEVDFESSSSANSDTPASIF